LHEESSTIKTFDTLEYRTDVLLFLRSKLDEFAIDCFKMVARQHNHNGLIKSKMIEDYSKKRYIYERAFNFLEAQGFIEIKELGNMKPYFITSRGRQLAELIKRESTNI
jgi:predicted transcriptional regulator